MALNGIRPLLLILIVVTAGCVASTDTVGSPSPAATPTPTPSPTTSPTATPSPTPTEEPPQNPWRADVVTVTIADRGVAERNNSAYVRQAVDYWNENMSDHTSYSFELRYVPDKFNADVIIRFQKVVECGGTYDKWGCAPIIDPDDIADDRTHIRIKTNVPEEQAADLIAHEIGHVLGLEHSEDPPVMAATLPDIDRPVTDATQRTNPFLNDELLVYVDLTAVPTSERAETEEQVGHAMTYVQEAINEKYDLDITIRETDDISKKHVRVSFSSESECAPGSCVSIWGYDLDGDEPLEYYTEAGIEVAEIDVEARGWHFGHWLAWSLYQVDQPLPNPLEPRADYDDRRDDWWNTKP